MMLGEPIIPTAVTRESTENTTPMVRMAGVTLSGSSEVVEKRKWKKVLSNRNPGKQYLNNINLEVFPGEIVGIAGVEGNGQTELVQVLTGLRQIDSGTLTLNGERVAHIPADRHRHGISLNDRIDE